MVSKLSTIYCPSESSFLLYLLHVVLCQGCGVEGILGDRDHDPRGLHSALGVHHQLQHCLKTNTREKRAHLKTLLDLAEWGEKQLEK